MAGSNRKVAENRAFVKPVTDESKNRCEDPPMEQAEVQCPTCFEWFEVTPPAPEECPAEWDYDCEICCRPMILVFDGTSAWAKSLGD
jgi:hypothetical protein